ncbi:MAG: S1 family peptidase, partial [Defluviitaleaceae bacterium]|nr:S1 family peptidase [Defluviitaleaceae bacterium]
EEHMVQVIFLQTGRSFLQLENEYTLDRDDYELETESLSEHTNEFANIVVSAASTALFMGDRIQIRWPGQNVNATLGHPSGPANMLAMVYTTNHDIVPLGAGIYRNNVRIGSVQRPIFSRALGTDVSRVQLNNSFIMSPQILATGQNITNFYGPRPGAGQFVRYRGATSGEQTGTVWISSMDAPMEHPITGQVVIMQGVILVTIRGTYGDSGAALIHGTSVAGTLSFGNEDQGWVAFSAPINYRGR